VIRGATGATGAKEPLVLKEITVDTEYRKPLVPKEDTGDTELQEQPALRRLPVIRELRGNGC